MNYWLHILRHPFFHNLHTLDHNGNIRNDNTCVIVNLMTISIIVIAHQLDLNGTMTLLNSCFIIFNFTSLFTTFGMQAKLYLFWLILLLINFFEVNIHFSFIFIKWVICNKMTQILHFYNLLMRHFIIFRMADHCININHHQVTAQERVQLHHTHLIIIKA